MASSSEEESITCTTSLSERGVLTRISLEREGECVGGAFIGSVELSVVGFVVGSLDSSFGDPLEEDFDEACVIFCAVPFDSFKGEGLGEGVDYMSSHH